MSNENLLSCGWQHESFRLHHGADLDYGTKQLVLSCCRNDWAGAAIVLRPLYKSILLLEDRSIFSEKGDFPIIRVQVTCPGLPAATVYRAQMHLDDDKVYKADALADWGSEIIDSWVPAQLFLKLKIPQQAKPGSYQGKVKFFGHSMFDDEKMLAELDFTVKVADVALPENKDRKFHLVIWQHPSNIARHHEVNLFSERHFELLDNYTRALSEMGNKSATIIVADIPWAGQSCFRTTNVFSDLFEYNMVRIKKDKNAKFCYDFSILERYLNLCQSYDMTRDIYIFGLIRNWQDDEYGYGNITDDYPDAIRLRYIDETDGCAKYMRKASEIKAYIAALHKWLATNNWLDRCLVSADEPPDMDAYNESLAALEQAAPGFKKQLDIRPALINQRPELEFSSYTPLISELAEDEAIESGSTALAMQRSKETNLFSVCCWPLTPNTFWRSSLLEARLHGPLAEWLKMDGFLRWAFTCWSVDPIRYGVCRDWPSGDAFLVYPKKSGEVMLSLRYFALKRGFADYELMQMVKEECPAGQEIVDQILQRLIVQQDITRWNFYQADESQFNFCPDAYDAAKDSLIQALLAARA